MHNWKGDWINENGLTPIPKSKITNLYFNERGKNREGWYLFRYFTINT